MFNAVDLFWIMVAVIVAYVAYLVYKELTRPKQTKSWWEMIDDAVDDTSDKDKEK